MSSTDQAQQTLKLLADEGRDLFLYSGEITQSNVNRVIAILMKARSRKRTKASLVLTTPGGDANHAYRLARLFQERYGPENFRLVVLGPCKSAGTLVAIGAGELAMGPFGELGPLDVQLAKRDEIAIRRSGLDTLGALAMLQTEAFAAFENYMVAMIKRSGGIVSTKTACDISATIVSGLFQPIASQIDPHQLSEVERMMKIAQQYGERLGTPNLKDRETGEALRRLIRDYPTHEFIIDREETSEIFEAVAIPSEAEQVVVGLFPQSVMYYSEEGETEIRDVVNELESISSSAQPSESRPGSGQPSGIESYQGDGAGAPPHQEGEASDSVAGVGPNGSEQPPLDHG